MSNFYDFDDISTDFFDNLKDFEVYTELASLPKKPPKMHKAFLVEPVELNSNEATPPASFVWRPS